MSSAAPTTSWPSATSSWEHFASPSESSSSSRTWARETLALTKPLPNEQQQLVNDFDKANQMSMFTNKQTSALSYKESVFT
jgi:guanyl-specific ribonuclease Sa